MKIACPSCQSKYNVSDEKVQGKTVKIRCRKCGATILVNSNGAVTGGAAQADAGGPGSAPGADAGAYHVNVADGDQRSMSVAELVDAYNAGVVNQETYVWTEGMEDWLPLAQVEPIVSALNQGQDQGGATSVAPPEAFVTPGTPGPEAFMPMMAQAAASQPHAADANGGGYGGGALASAPPAAPSEPTAEKRAAVVKREGGRGTRDLFAPTDDVQTSAPQVAGGHEGNGLSAYSAGSSEPLATGQRNENSVLFSLSALTSGSKEPEQKTTATREDSGLIDLKALAAAANIGGPQKASPLGMSDSSLPFGSPLGVAPLAPIGSPLVSPSLDVGSIAPPAQQKQKMTMFIAIGGGMALLAGAIIFAVVKLSGDKPVAATTAPTATATSSATAAPTDTGTAAATSPDGTASAGDNSAAPPATGTGNGTGKKPPATVATNTKPGQTPTAKPTAAPTTTTPAAAPTTPPKPKPSGGKCGCAADDLMCQMKCSVK